MKLRHLLKLAFLLFLCNCQDKKVTGFEITLDSKNETDTIYISELITDKPITKIHKNNETKTILLDKPTFALIHSKDKEYLTILVPNKKLNISFLSDVSLTTKNISDSLANYLWKSTTSTFLTKTNYKDSIPILGEKFREEREKEINKHTNQLSPEITEVLNYQNMARIYSLLFFWGRTNKGYSPNDSYFNFIEKIPEPSEALKSLPVIYLYKYEIEYLREHPVIESIPHFLQFIEKKTENKDLSDFLKATYIKSLIDGPSNWRRHEKLFNTVVLKEILNSEKNNTYQYIIEKTTSDFFALQKGEPAYFFQAEDRFGNNFNLENLKGKVIFIDTWATWCGPCIAHRPQVIKFAEKYKDNDDVAILMVSVDSDKDKWLTFLEKENNEFGYNLYIENGMQTTFGSSYNIKSIPRYILIGKDGNIINSNMNEPSLATENEIEKALAKNY